jgi:CheY-like chemotaxis protein
VEHDVSQVKETFAKQVRDALAHLSDTAHLQEHALCQVFAADLRGRVTSAQALRRVLLDAIEDVRPVGQVPYSAKEWRPYRVLFRRYVQRMSLLSILEELAISERQYQREHARALRAVTTLLWDRAQQSKAGEGDAPVSSMDKVSAEVRRLVTGAQRAAIDGEKLVRGVMQDVKGLAKGRSVVIDLDYRMGGAPIYGDRGLLRQVLLSILSHLLAQAEDGDLHIIVDGTDGEVHLAFALDCRCQTTLADMTEGTSQRLELSKQLTKAIGGRFWVTENAIHLRLPLQRSILLVVDDNRQVIDMFQRFLANGRFKVVGAQTADEALALAREVRPSLIMLDVMMPIRDGWEALQNLKHNPATCDIPVIVCSILNEPELAMSLGADGYIQKPVTQRDLLILLERWEQGGSVKAS